MTQYSYARVLLAVALAALGACKDNNGPRELGPPANMAIVAGTPTARANTQLTGLQLVVRDSRNAPIPNQTVMFTVIEGGGSIQQTTGTTGADGTTPVPAWLLGKSAIPQKLRATVGTLTFDIEATIQTQYNIVVRFYGPAMTTAQQALFTNAAARLRAVIIGELANVTTGNTDLTQCLGSSTTINETIDDLVIYATIADIDGPGKVLASAGPCYVRSGKNAAGLGGVDSLTSIIGVMRFDSNDIGNIPANTLQNIILHEMLHVVGVGSMWLSDGWNLVSGAGTATPRYTGLNGRQGCLDVGGTITCSSSVPVENNDGPGTADVHWEEDMFDTELMTGYVEGGGVAMPLSLLTVKSLADIGYTINVDNFDPYTKPFGALRANAMLGSDAGGRSGPFEHVGAGPIFTMDPAGKVGKQLRGALK